MDDIAFAPAHRLAQRIKLGEIGCLELLEHYLARVERFNGPLNAIIHLDVERARARAGAADEALRRGEDWGPLHGLAMTVKDSYDVAGWPSTRGLPELRDNIASANAVVVDRLLDAGAVIFGKTNVPAHLKDFQSYNEIHGTTNNPWNLERTPGGSSGGSAAALAAGMSALEAGSDIGGSIRNPAHFCGVLGLKPTWGIVPPRGQSMPGVLTPNDISCVGPLARTAADLALALDVLAGPDVLAAPGWRLELPAPRKTRLADYKLAVWLSDEMSEVDGEVVDSIQAIADGLARAGATVDDSARPDFASERYQGVYIQLLRGVTEAGLAPEALARARKEADALEPADMSYRACLVRGAAQFHHEWLKVNEARTHFRWAWRAFFEEYDLLLVPAAASTAFAHDHWPERMERTIAVNGRQVPYLDQLFWAGLAGLCFLPATVAPIGLGAASGLPVGVQIIGPECADRTTIEFARLLAESFGGFTPPPGYA